MPVTETTLANRLKSAGYATGLVGKWHDLAAESLPDQTKKGTSAVRLYNLRDDIGETQDLSASQPDILKKLQSQWDLWNTNNIPPGSSDGGTKAEGGTKKRKQNEK